MTKDIAFDADFVVELGCGTGSMTHHIDAQIANKENYLGFEINRDLHVGLTKRFGSLRIVKDSATELRRYLPEEDQPINVILSSLPFTSLSPALSEQILSLYVDALAPGGLFRMFLYTHTYPMPRNQRFIQHVSQYLELTSVETVWKNFPPAKVVTFQKRSTAAERWSHETIRPAPQTSGGFASLPTHSRPGAAQQPLK